jgi:hypothetical protein
MMVVRVLLAVAMMVVGGTIVVRMLPYGIAQTFTGLILGLAMLALGAYRLHQLYRYGRAQR